MSQPSAKPAFERREADWLDVAEAAARIQAAAGALDPEQVPLGEALGRALAAEVVAAATLPPWDNSAMDGYAVRADDVERAGSGDPVVLRVVGVVRAGDVSPLVVGPGEAARIMTGAPIPHGADTVVRVEDTDGESDAGRVTVLAPSERGRHVRGAGQDVLEGEALLPPGHTITPGTVGLLAAAGCGAVTVYRRPTVGILTTGDELRDGDRYDDVRTGRGVPDSNAPMLEAMVRAAGGHPVRLGIARDQHDDIRQRLLAGSECDSILAVGGASMGEADLVKRVLDDLGFDLSFWRVKMRPGSPVSFGWLTEGRRRQPVFGLPGNPSSAFVTFEVFMRPFLRRLAGHARTQRRVVTCRSADRMRLAARLTHYQRVVVSSGDDGALIASLTGSQGSGLVGGLARVDGLAVVPPDVEAIEPGDRLSVMLLDDAPASA